MYSNFNLTHKAMKISLRATNNLFTVMFEFLEINQNHLKLL